MHILMNEHDEGRWFLSCIGRECHLAWSFFFFWTLECVIVIWSGKEQEEEWMRDYTTTIRDQPPHTMDAVIFHELFAPN